MKTNLKRIKSALFLPALAALAALPPLQAQSHQYERSGITVVHTRYGDSYQAEIDRIFGTYRPENRYDENRIVFRSADVPGSRDHRQTKDGKTVYVLHDINVPLVEYLNRENVGLQIVSALFNRQPDGTMDLSLIQHRGQYNATDQDFLQSTATKRGVDELKDFGERLIAHSYVTVFDYQNIRYEYSTERGSTDGEYYWVASSGAYLYQIMWSEELLYAIYDCWITEEDDEAARAAKNAAYENLRIPLRYVVSSLDEEYSVDTRIEYARRNPTSSEASKSADQLKREAFVRLVAGGAERGFDRFEENYERFALKTGIYDVRPVRAKLGLKEGLKEDDAFFVYENYQKADGSIGRKRVGVIRATDRICNNMKMADGKGNTSEFYQFAGRRVEPGQDLTEKKLSKMAIEVGYTAATLGGFRIGWEYDRYMSRHAQLFTFVDLQLDGVGFNAGANVGYGFRMNNFQLYPFAGVRYDSLYEIESSGDESDYGVYASAGVKMNLNIVFPVQFYAMGGYNILFSASEAYADALSGDPGNRVAGVFFGLGLRYYF